MQDFNSKSRRFILTKDRGSMDSGSMRPDPNVKIPQNLTQFKAEQGTKTSNNYLQFVIEYIYVLCSPPLREKPRYSESFL